MAITMMQTACPLDCPDGCSLTVGVENGRLLSVDATPVGEAANALTAGFICQKVKHHAKRVHGPDRIHTPLVRTGPKGSAEFRQASWDEALALGVGRGEVEELAEGGIDIDGFAERVDFEIAGDAGSGEDENRA